MPEKEKEKEAVIFGRFMLRFDDEVRFDSIQKEFVYDGALIFENAPFSPYSHKCAQFVGLNGLWDAIFEIRRWYHFGENPKKIHDFFSQYI